MEKVDLINRHTLFNAIYDALSGLIFINARSGKTLAQECVNRMWEAIKNAPAVDAVVVKHGWWKYNRENRFTVPISCRITCSNCLTNMVRVDGEDFKFCPHCGAKMDGKSNVRRRN